MTSNNKFERGDKVRAKTGGPIMTVEAAPDHMAYCIWFEGAIPHEGTFHSESLELVMSRTRAPPMATNG